MEFNRFDILEAYYVFGTNFHRGQSSKEYAYMGRCLACGFKPKPGLNVNTLTENGRAIYMALRLKKTGK
jgi:hypothetical protein